jgi:hypothetical protein
MWDLAAIRIKTFLWVHQFIHLHDQNLAKNNTCASRRALRLATWLRRSRQPLVYIIYAIYAQ